MRFLAVLLAAMIAVSGCVQDDGESPGAHEPLGDSRSPDDGGTGSGPEPPDNSSRDSDQQLPDPLGSSVHLDGCTGSMVGHTWPPGTFPGHTPSAWDPGEDSFAPTSKLVVLNCDRFASSQLERPGGIILEGHNNADFPDTCRDVISDRQPWVVEHAWANDPDIATMLSDWTGWDIGVANITTIPNSDVQQPYHISLNIDGAVTTWDVVDEGGRSELPFFEDLWMWPQSNGSLVATPIAYEGTPPDITERPGVLTSEGELLLSEAPQPVLTSDQTFRGHGAKLDRYSYANLDCS